MFLECLSISCVSVRLPKKGPSLAVDSTSQVGAASRSAAVPALCGSVPIPAPSEYTWEADCYRVWDLIPVITSSWGSQGHSERRERDTGSQNENMSDDCQVANWDGAQLSKRLRQSGVNEQRLNVLQREKIVADGRPQWLGGPFCQSPKHNLGPEGLRTYIRLISLPLEGGALHWQSS